MADAFRCKKNARRLLRAGESLGEPAIIAPANDSPQAAVEQGHEAAAAVQRDQVVAAADVGVADEDLRHRAAAA
jgi:hypothetical protein